VSGRLTKLLEATGLGRMTDGEYQANLSGINIFFGAVLGFVLAGAERLKSWQFGLLLLGLSSAVITILYISSSKRRASYSVLALVYALGFPEVMDVLLGGRDLVPDKIRPTLVVWTLITVLVEFWSRDSDRGPQAELRDGPGGVGGRGLGNEGE
jgi:hypothetical protein